MTYLQPNQQGSIVNRILAGLVAACVIGVFAMVWLDNATVNLGHNLASVRAQADAIGAQSTAFNNTIVQSLSAAELSTAVANDGLVADNYPEYFPAPQWQVASHY